MTTSAPKTAAKATKAAAKPAAAPKAKAAPKPKAAAKPSTRRAATKRGAKPLAILPENHTPSEAAAFEIRMDRIDLSPSVTRIVGAGLTEPGTLHALNLFRDSLGSLGDPNRDPSVAIEAARLIDARS